MRAPDRVYQWLYDRILDGEFAEGTFLDEVWVADAVGTSRTPVREAFHLLKAERFIDLVPRKGAQVRFVSEREMRDVLESRLLIEQHAARGLCASGKGAPLKAVQLLEDLSDAEQSCDWPLTAQLNRTFHRSIVDFYGNSVLLELYDALKSRQLRVGVRELEGRSVTAESLNVEHRRILSALNDCDADLACDLLKQHLFRNEER